MTSAPTSPAPVVIRARGAVASWYRERVREPGPLEDCPNVPVRELYRDFSRWCESRGLAPTPAVSFGMMLTAEAGSSSRLIRSGERVLRTRRLFLSGDPLPEAPAGGGVAAALARPETFLEYVRRRAVEQSPVGSLARDLIHDFDVRCPRSRLPLCRVDDDGRVEFGSDPCASDPPETASELFMHLADHSASEASYDAAARAWVDYMRWRDDPGFDSPDPAPPE